MTDESAARADALVTAFILRKFREDTRENEMSQLASFRAQVTDAARHLAHCDDARVEDEERTNGAYGCDTGCEYARLEATITCSHGCSEDFEYGEFGDLADLLAEVIEQQQGRVA